MSPARHVVRTVTALAALLSTSCRGATEACDPADPLCGDTTQSPPISSIEITSPIDSVIAVGRSAQLSAVARGPNGNAVSASFTWTSSNESVAIVGGAGFVTAQAVGTTTISATAETVSGNYRMRAVAADLGTISALLSDAYFVSLVGALDQATAAELNGFLTACSNGIASGNVLAVATCLNDSIATSAANGNDTALLGMLDLFFGHSIRLLQLGR